MRVFLLILLIVSVLPGATASGAPAFEANWESLQQYKCPAWFREAKIGIFLHWGVNTVPAYDGHYGRHMYLQDPGHTTVQHQQVYAHHLQTYGHPSQFGYKDFIPMWRAERWDPDRLVGFFKRNGARYIVPVAVHCDNFDNYDSSHQPYNSVKMGPRRDIVGEWKRAAVKHGLRFGVSSHVGDWVQVWYSRSADSSGPKTEVLYDVCDKQYANLYGHRPGDRSKMQEGFPENWYLRTKELVDRYQPDLLYFDGQLPYEQEFGLQLAAHFYNANREWHQGRLEAVLNVKHHFSEGAVVYDIEKGQADRLRVLPWQTDTTLNSGWFYQDRLYGDELPSGLRLDETVLIDNLVDIVSKNGNLLLNVGLRADGTLPDNQRQVLEELGRWLDVNGEAIYGTRPWITYGEGPTQIKTGFDTEPRSPWNKQDIRFTTKGRVLYVIPLDWPGGPFTVKTLSDQQTALGAIESITLLGNESKLAWTRSSAGLTITPPDQPACDYAFVFKVQMAAAREAD